MGVGCQMAQIGCTPFCLAILCHSCRDLGAQNANLGPGLAQIAQPVRIPEICLGKRLKTVLFGAQNGGRLPHGSDRLYSTGNTAVHVQL